MGTDLHRYTARIQTDPNYRPYLPSADPTAAVLVAGYHAAFAVPPRPGTPIAVFPGLDPSITGSLAVPVMALVRVEYASHVVTVNADGSSRIRWDEGVFDRLPTGFGWRLAPVERESAGRWVIADGHWAAGGRQALLPRSVTVRVPGAPVVVAVHDHDPYTGRRWPW